MKKTDRDTIDQTARAAALAVACDTFWPSTPSVRSPFTGYRDAELARISDGMGTGRPNAPDHATWRVGSRRAKPAHYVPCNVDDAYYRGAILEREYNPSKPGQGEHEARNLEKRFRREQRGQHAGSTTFDASMRRLQLAGKLAKQERSCKACEGTGVDLEYLNITELPCPECIGTGRRAITQRRRKWTGWCDPDRFCYTLELTTLDTSQEPATLTMLLHDREEARKQRVRVKAFTPKPGRKNTGAGCARRVHKWNEDATQKWCHRCGKVSLKKRIES